MSDGAQTVINLRSEAHHEAKLRDWLAAWDQGDDLWTLDQIRFVDGMKAVGRPGTFAVRSLARYRYFDRGESNLPDYVVAGRNRPDGPWVGDLWDSVDPIHRIEIENFKRLLAYRYANA